MFSSILVPVDLDEPSSWGKALPIAIAIARCTGAALTLATVLQDRPLDAGREWTASAYRNLLSRTETRLGTLADELRGEFPVATRVGGGGIAGGILGLANDIGADLIVLWSHRPSMRDWLIGANAERVMRHARCSVLVVRDEER